MAFCNQCGAQLQDGAAFCPACGAQQGATSQQAAPQQGQAGQAGSGFDFKAMIENTPDFTSQMDPADIEANKPMAILSYIWFLFIVPLVAAPQSKFARFHANQGLSGWTRIYGHRYSECEQRQGERASFHRQVPYYQIIEQRMTGGNPEGLSPFLYAFQTTSRVVYCRGGRSGDGGPQMLGGGKLRCPRRERRCFLRK